MSTLQQYFFIFSVLISLVVLGNYLIHMYYKGKQKVVELEIQNLKHEKILDIELTQEWNFGFRYNKADLILLENQLIIYVYKYNLKGVIKQAQPIVLLYKTPCNLISSKGFSYIQPILEVVIKENSVILKTKMNSLFQSKIVSFEFYLSVSETLKVFSFMDLQNEDAKK